MDLYYLNTENNTIFNRLVYNLGRSVGNMSSLQSWTKYMRQTLVFV